MNINTDMFVCFECRLSTSAISRQALGPETRRMGNPPNHFPKEALEGVHQPLLEHTSA